ncbi:Resolvase/invertase-type recombinase catalytic domain-containing protein [Pseudomonas sp. IT-232MI5]|jgi:hypothetical protein|uniref:hypothetical protein n=1 Tax=Pseudomonas sp. IT-232MI5 TaxID=3026442 RepID=UPI0039E02F4D
MKKLKNFTAYGTPFGTDKNIKLDEISLLADPETIKNLGLFLINASYEMEINELEHIHLQDVLGNFSHKKHVDLIAINQNIVKPLKK